MNSFNLNIQDYTVNDLIEIYDLEKNYTITQLNTKYNKMKKNIDNNDQIDDIKKNNLIQFFTHAKSILTNVITNNNLNDAVGTIKSSNQAQTFYKNMTLMNNPTINEEQNYLLNNDVQGFIENERLPKYEDAKKLGIIQNKTKTLTYLLNIDSKFRKNYYTTNTSNFSVDIPYKLQNVVSMQLRSIELPNSWYLFDSIKKTNIFYAIAPDDNNFEKKYRISIDQGNYDVDSLKNNLLYEVEISNNVYIPATYFPLDIDINMYNGKTTIRHKSSSIFTLDFNIDGRDSPFNMGWALGYRMNKYQGAFTYTSEGLYNAGTQKYLFFIVKDFQNHTNDKIIALFQKSYMAKDILAKIPLSTSSFTILFEEQNNSARKREYLSPVNINKLEFEIVDEYGDIINLNNMDFSVTLQFECLYDQDK